MDVKESLTAEVVYDKLSETDVATALEQISKITGDSFPYKKYSTNVGAILERFDRLKKYSPTIRKGYAPVYNLPRDTPRDLLKYNGENQYIYVSSECYDKYDNISDYFQEHIRLQCTRYDLSDSSSEWWNKNKEQVVKTALEKYNIITAHTLREVMYSLHYECTSFKPSLFVAFAKLFSPKKVLDISSGWGDRLIGAIASEIELYVGVDPNKKLYAGYDKIIKTLPGKTKAVMIQSGFETADISEYGPFDMMLTSPPYYDLEKFTDEEGQSIDSFKSLESWYNNFLIFSIKKVIDNIRSGGHIVININDIRGQEDYVIRMVKDVNKLTSVKYKGCLPQYTGIKNKSAQPFWVWMKL